MILAFAALCEMIARAPSLQRALLLGWAFGFGQFCVGLNWIATAFTYQAAMPAWLGWVAVFLLSLYLAVYPMLAAGLAWRLGRTRRIALLLALAGGWAISEWLRATMFTGFAWNPVGAVLVDTPLMGASGAVGTYGLSALTVLIGGALWLAWRREAWPVGAIGAALLLVWAFPTAPVPRSNQVIKPIRIVQPNIGQEDKWREGLSEETFVRLESLSASGIAAPRLLFWPEVAVVEPFQILGPDQRPLPVPLPAIPRAAQSIRPGDLLITGAFALIADSAGMITGNTNSVFALNPKGQILGRYDKAHLVPYGEYLPMRPLLSAIGLSQLAPGQGDTVYGPGPRTIDLGAWGKVGLQVCYEIVFSGEVVDRANRPDFLFNPSNDAWFGRWGPPQHLAMARLRAAEEGLPVVRSTPTGISALIDARGELLASLPWRKAGTIDAFLPPPADGLSPFARWGNIIPLALGFLLLLGAIALGRGARYRQT
ncbi:MAG: apolipoprotein N-acyltransferase [Pseudomonadota bacterium]|nr:apolipoprotein N-acyltransferase [Pseudomonadota bacterium]